MIFDSIDCLVPADPAELQALGFDAWTYGGAARPPLSWWDDCRARGIPPRVLIRETYPTRSKAGLAAGALDVGYQEASGDEVRHTGANAVVVSDGNYLDAWDCSGYAQGWASGARRRFFPYGSVACCASFRAAVRGHPLLIDGDWIPSTWGQGSVASQLVGVQTAISTGHDLNRVFYDFGGTTPRQENEMGYYHVTAASPHFPEGSDWDNAGSGFLRCDGVDRAKVFVRDIAGADLELIRERQERADAAAKATLGEAGGDSVDVDAVVTAALAPIQNGHDVEAAQVEAAIRGALG